MAPKTQQQIDAALKKLQKRQLPTSPHQTDSQSRRKTGLTRTPTLDLTTPKEPSKPTYLVEYDWRVFKLILSLNYGMAAILIIFGICCSLWLHCGERMVTSTIVPGLYFFTVTLFPSYLLRKDKAYNAIAVFGFIVIGSSTLLLATTIFALAATTSHINDLTGMLCTSLLQLLYLHLVMSFSLKELNITSFWSYYYGDVKKTQKCTTF